MKIYRQCDCGYLFALSKIAPNFVFRDENDTFKLVLQSMRFNLDYCPSCGGRFFESLKNIQCNKNATVCNCRLTEHLEKAIPSHLIRFDKKPIGIKLNKSEEPSPSEKFEIEEIVLWLNRCFKCGQCLIEYNEDVVPPQVIYYPIIELMESTRKKILKISSKEDIIKEFGKPYETIEAGYDEFKQSTTNLNFSIIKQTFCYKIDEAFLLRFNFYKDGDLGFEFSLT